MESLYYGAPIRYSLQGVLPVFFSPGLFVTLYGDLSGSEEYCGYPKFGRGTSRFRLVTQRCMIPALHCRVP